MSTSCRVCRGQCCYNALIRVTGDDVRRIVRSQRLAARSFVDAVDVAGRIFEGPDVTVRLGDSPRRYVLALRHSSRVPGACGFLLLLREHQPCGIYADRPTVCRVYPVERRAAEVRVRDGIICRPEDWERDALADPAWADAIRRRDEQWRTYELIVAVWNARFAEREAGDADRYCAYLAATYDALDAPPTRTSVQDAVRTAAEDALRVTVRGA